MKNLTVVYNGVTLVDVDVDEFSWQDADGQVAVSARWKKPGKPAGSAGGGLLDLISSVSKQRTQAVVDEKREQAGLPLE